MSQILLEEMSRVLKLSIRFSALSSGFITNASV